MAIFITGDIHASYDIAKLTESQFDTRALSKDDYVIICGDFGLVWDDTPSEQYWLRWLDARPFTTLFVDGNHEGFTRLNGLPVETWHGGRVHRVGESILHLMRGELFDIDGLRVFAMGGAASSAYDKEHREEGITWFPEEIPSQAERDHACETLEDAGWTCDYVITHCAPTSAADGIAQKTDRLEVHPMDEYTDWLETLRQRLTFRHWFCGHYHVDAQVDPDVSVMYNLIALLDGAGGESDVETGCARDRAPYVICEPQPTMELGELPEADPEDFDLE